MNESKILITGANGQLGRALIEIFPTATVTDVDELDITDSESVENYHWTNIQTIINAAGYTNVDGAETPDGKKAAWKVNDEAVGHLADAAVSNDLLLVHVSTAYVFDGHKRMYKEDDVPNPLGEYAKSKAAGDQKAAKVPKHYIVRTDSVIGEGKNFVRTMLGLAKKGVSPIVVADQIIRPTFTNVLAEAIKFLIDKPVEFGVYNVTNEGEPISWADFTRVIFEVAGIEQAVTNTTLAEYSASKPGTAPRPRSSVLDLSKIEAIGFVLTDWRQDLRQYISKELRS